MAWPVNARYETLVAGVTAVKKTFGDAMQDAIINLYGGDRTVVSLHADGTGDQASAAGAGSIHATNGFVTASGNVTAFAGDIGATLGNVSAGSYLAAGGTRSSTTAGAGQGLTIGRIYKDTAPVAWCWIEMIAGPSCRLGRGVNINSVTYTGLGRYTVQLVNGAANLIAPVATVFDNTAAFVGVALTGHTSSQFEVNVYDPAIPGNKTDPAVGGGVFVAVYGG